MYLGMTWIGVPPHSLTHPLTTCEGPILTSESLASFEAKMLALSNAVWAAAAAFGTSFNRESMTTMAGWLARAVISKEGR